MGQRISSNGPSSFWIITMLSNGPDSFLDLRAEPFDRGVWIGFPRDTVEQLLEGEGSHLAAVPDPHDGTDAARCQERKGSKRKSASMATQFIDVSDAHGPPVVLSRPRYPWLHDVGPPASR